MKEREMDLKRTKEECDELLEQSVVEMEKQ
jgi:hypothetical protein